MECLQIGNFLPTIHMFFSVLNYIKYCAATSRNDLISNWAFQWKMIFNPDLTKQAPVVIFSRKTKKLLHPSLSFNNILLKNIIFQKHLGLTLDIKLNFVEHIKISLKKLVKIWAYSVGFNQTYQDHL